MARLPRLCPADIPAHIIHRGHDRNPCFADKCDYLSYLGLLSEGAQFYGVEVHAWVLMTNHVHILATPTSDRSISKLMQHVGSHYTRYFNRLYNRSGTLWEGRFKSCLVDEEVYFLVCQRYIELNPVRAQMVAEPGDYPWSSYRTNALGEASKLTVPHGVYTALGSTIEERQCHYQQLFTEGLNAQKIDNLRHATHSGLAFGSELFKDQIEKLFKRRVRAENPGRKTKH